jgi:16S rRNA (uracil1498-N3)-methyltransferase
MKLVIKMQRYFAVDKDLNISDKDKHHIINVMRMKLNDKIEIVYNEKVYMCEINDISKKDVSYSVKDIIDVNNELPLKVTIAVSLVNEKKLDFILQKCTELGVYDFILVNSDRSKIKIDGKEKKKIERWNTITKEAAEQSHRNIKPIVRDIMSINDVSKLDYDLKLTCSTKENEKTIKNVLQNSTNCDRIIIVVGPEGGLTVSEEEKLEKNGFIPVTLGNLILRTETVPIYIMSLVNYEVAL